MLRDSWIMEDVFEKLDIGQFGGQPGTGTEHMIVCLVDRIVKLLDRNTDMPSIVSCPTF